MSRWSPVRPRPGGLPGRTFTRRTPKDDSPMAWYRPHPDTPPKLKTADEIAKMRRAGVLVAQAHQIVRDMARVGTRTIDIDRAVEDFFVSHHAIPLFKGYPGKVPFPGSICASINEEVVHGVPGS